jgi:dynein heavy chain
MVLLQGIQNQGKYVKFFEKTVALWMSNLGAVETVLRDWYEVQGKWASLETIFLGSADIRVQLPEDSKRFDSIDEDFRALMIEVLICC